MSRNNKNIISISGLFLGIMLCVLFAACGGGGGGDDAGPGTPSFGSEMIDTQSYRQGTQISALTLPVASGGNGDLTYSIDSELPDGLTFDPSTRRLSGTPSGSGLVAGSNSILVTYTATDENRNKATLSFRIEIEVIDSMPGFGSETIGDRTYIEGVLITTLPLPAATGGDAPLIYSLTPLPDGLIFDSGTRELSGTPTAVVSTVSTDMTYTARDADGDTATLMFSITVAEDTIPMFSGMIDNQNYINGVVIPTETLPEATGGNGALTYSIDPVSPFGLTFNSDTRTLSGTPSRTGGPETVTYTARDTDGDSISLMFTITVEANLHPTFGAQTIADQNYINGVAITPLNLPEATGGNAPLAYSFTGLPTGLRLESGQLVGTPAEVVSGRRVTYTVRDANGDVDTLVFNITVAADTQPDFGTQTISDQNYINGVAITPLDLPEATGGNAPLAYSFTGLPAGLRLESGQLVGTPAEVVSGQTATYTVRDANGDEDMITFMITVAADTPPDFGSETISDQNYINGIAITPLDLPEATGGNAPLAYSFTGLPAGLRLESGQLVGTPAEVVSGRSVTYTIRDANGDEDMITFMITVAADTPPDFGSETISDQNYINGIAITPLDLPEATGGNVPLAYSFTGLPAGLRLESGQLVGTPAEVVSGRSVTYTVRDANGDVDTLMFTVTSRMPQNKNICSRTRQVREHILSRIGGGVVCESVSEVQLAGVNRLDLQRDGVTSLQSGDFDDLIGLERLDFRKWIAGVGPGHILEDDVDGLTSLPEDVFEGLVNLTYLDLSTNDITSLPEGVFNGLSKLETLDLTSNELTSIPEDLFDGLSSLKVLALTSNDITSLPEELFAGLSKLEQLWINDNAISSLSENQFAGLSNLEDLILTDNRLRTVPSDVFDGLSNLEELSLRDNDITVLPTDVFQDLSSIETLRLRGNNLGSLQSDLFDGLTTLDLLRIDSNGLTALPEDLFDGLTSLRQIYMTRNNIMTFPANLFDGLPALNRLDMGNNNNLDAAPAICSESRVTCVLPRHL